MARDNLTPFAHQALDCAVQNLTEEVGRAFLAPGREVAWDDCCDGQLWLRVINILPAGDSRSQGACGAPMWLVTWGLGVVRCAAVLDDQGNPPPPENLTLDFDQTMQDRADLEAAIRCCIFELAPSLHFLRWEPLGPQGGCVGGEWQFSTSAYICACST